MVKSYRERHYQHSVTALRAGTLSDRPIGLFNASLVVLLGGAVATF